MSATRREFLGRTGQAAATVVGVAALGDRVRADHDERQPADVQLVYDQDRLHQHRPLLDMNYADYQRLVGLYGWIAQSPSYDTDVYVYWCKYTDQEAPWWAPGTGHLGDHEPVQVEVDKATGEVQRVRASIFHWIKGEVTGSVMPLDEAGQRPELRVINPHHQYTAATNRDNLQAIPVDNLHDVYPGMLANGLEESLVPGASKEPWLMRYEEDFWRAGEFGLPFGLGGLPLPDTAALRLSILQNLGFGESGTLARPEVPT
jgi:hypothetical protein